jgi:uncharacterized protein (DUF169 family)
MSFDKSTLKSMAEHMQVILGLSASPVGVRLLSADDVVPQNAERLQGYRYCQALMEARHGRSVLLDGDGISCPAAAAAFGFRPLPENLRNGKGLVGFGIVANEAVGKRMFETMSTLAPGRISQLHLFPLDHATEWPDVVVVEDEVEKLMWLNLAYLHAIGGERILSTTAVLQATCVDSTIIPYLEGRLNFSYGCYGCRDATDLGGSETVVGFPVAVLPAMTDHLEYLNQKAIPTSRGKKAWAVLQKKNRKQLNPMCSAHQEILE